MANGDMLQVHLLTSYPAVLLNRDDAGLAKRMPFGGATRVRVSSQCLKKHWREAAPVRAFGDFAVRSTRVYEELVARPLREENQATPDEARVIASYLMAKTVGTKVDREKEAVHSGQLLVLTRAETEFLADQGALILKAVRSEGIEIPEEADPAKFEAQLSKLYPLEKKDQAEFRKTLRTLRASIDTALFGRMVTSDLFARVDAAVSVAHAFTTHAEQAEIDYFTAVDTLKTDQDDAGAALIQDTELTSGVFYIYSVFDMNQLRDNLGGDAEVAERLASELVRVMATASPGAKRGSTAPYAYAEGVLLERGSDQPRTLANAFMEPVRNGGGGLMEESLRRLLEYRDRLAGMYGSGPETVALATIHPVGDPRLTPVPLDQALRSTFRLDA